MGPQWAQEPFKRLTKYQLDFVNSEIPLAKGKRPKIFQEHLLDRLDISFSISPSMANHLQKSNLPIPQLGKSFLQFIRAPQILKGKFKIPTTGLTE